MCRFCKGRHGKAQHLASALSAERVAEQNKQLQVLTLSRLDPRHEKVQRQCCVKVRGAWLRIDVMERGMKRSLVGLVRQTIDDGHWSSCGHDLGRHHLQAQQQGSLAVGHAGVQARYGKAQHLPSVCSAPC